MALCPEDVDGLALNKFAEFGYISGQAVQKFGLCSRVRYWTGLYEIVWIVFHPIFCKYAGPLFGNW